MDNNNQIMSFVVLNWIFAGLTLIIILFFCLTMVYGIFLSGDTKQEIIGGALVLIITSLPAVAALIIYSLAGLGLIKRKKWGYYLHLTGAVLAVFSCIGIVYTIFAFIFAFKPEFKAEFGC